MRLIGTFNDQHKGHVLSNYLKEQGIDNQFELITNTDWGSPEYGNTTSRVWVIDEDQMEKSLKFLEEYEQNPKDPKFTQHDKKSLFLSETIQNTIKSAPGKIKAATTTRNVPVQKMGIITLYMLVLCSIIYGMSAFTSPEYTEPPPGLPVLPIYSSEIYKTLYFDYPQKYELEDQLIKDYGIARLRDPSDLPINGKALYEKVLATPYWEGFYDKIVDAIVEPDKPITVNEPLFEKIKQGELWRLFTPALLHSDILHLFFNMTWLIVLGRQIEQRLGSFRYLLFIIITGIGCNIAQYLVSGPNFLGFSGILCAMLTFVWIRQKKAAWEGYLLQDSTMGFMMFFLLTVLAIQVASFLLQINGKLPLSVSIANTAHFTGLILGVILGYMNYFSWKTNHP